MISRIPGYLKQSHSQLQAKFTYINKKEDALIEQALTTPDSQVISHTLNASLKRSNRIKNRYSNVLPYDQYRVKLMGVVDPVNDDYINASHIQLVSKKNKDMFTYISTQGPTSETVIDFWTMISEVPGDQINIVMLTPFEEKGREKCFNYLHHLSSNEATDDIPINSSKHTKSFRFRLNDINKTEILQITQFDLIITDPTGSKNNYTKKVTHYHILDWDDFGKPNEWKTLYQISQLIKTKNNPTPTVVHCSAGVGRSGTFIVLDYLFNSNLSEDLIPKDTEIDVIYETVKELRSFRVMMVQSFTQFLFLYTAIKQFMEKIPN